MKNIKFLILKRIIIGVYIFIIIFPLLTLLIWIFTERYTWPSILPTAYSFRALKSILFRKNELIKTFLLSIYISVIVASVSVIIAILSARAMSFYKFKGKGIISFLMISPFLIPSTVFAMGIQILFIKIGLGRTITGVIICHIIYSLPYANRIIEEGVRAYGKKFEEQAKVLGSSSFRSFFLISLPCLFPFILSAFIMSYIISISQYFLTLLIGGGSIKTFTIVMIPYMQSGERNFASIYAIIFLGVTLIVFFIFEKIAKIFMEDKNIEYFV